ncbi:SGNH/GDSL hydrolase family protein [Saccharothrix sp. ALI-22-I]|uniref:SGNH/GDSL hydrolase family protein n=1 Tax=Saccharothrix sp. ALI-22-I TaxID=1933778 RepID=UPI001EE6EAB6|nr:SGNH/GDSL hydrolase family protein [Saccharothrix sp. ALI-22-I]
MTEQLRFRVLGDSLAVGVGCARAEQTLGRLLTDVLRSAGHGVDLGVHAVSGARSTGLAAQVRAAVSTGADLALIVIGANDLTSFTLPAVGARLLHDAVLDLRRAGGQVVVATAPDLGVVSHVPSAYRAFVSQASGLYARAQADAVVRAGGVVAAVGSQLFDRFATDPGLFSADRFHPSPAGYALIADALAPYVLTAAGRWAA